MEDLDAIFEEYKEYYKARWMRVKDNPNYPFSAASEKKLYDTIDGCANGYEFRDRLGNLNELNAVALTKDQYTMRLTHYQSLQEHIRALGPQRILQGCETVDNVNDVMTLAMNEENKNSIEIAMDEAVREFHDWHYLEQIEIGEQAEVPSKWKSDYQQHAQQAKQKLVESYNDAEKNNQPWEEGWHLNLDLIWEHRHRRLLPYPDEVVQKRRNEAKQITGK